VHNDIATPLPASNAAAADTAVASSARSRAWTRVSILAVIASVACFGWATLFFPYGRDQGNYAYPAWAWLGGQMPYADVFVFKPPATLWVHALAQLSFGHEMWAIRALDLGWTTATALVLANLVRAWTGKDGAGILAAALYALCYLNLGFWNTAQTDPWMCLPALLGTWCAQRGARSAAASRWPWLLFAGTAFGLAACFKYTAAAFTLTATPAAWGRREGRVPAFAALALGMLVAPALTAAWLAQGDALGAFVESQWGMLPGYFTDRSRSSGLLSTLWGFWDRTIGTAQLRYIPVFVVLGALPLARAARGLELPRLPRQAVLHAALLFLAGAISCMAQRKFFVYHYGTAIPGAAAMAAMGLWSLFPSRFAHPRLLALAVAVAFVLPSALPRHPRQLGPVILGQESLAQYWDRSEFRINQMSVSDNVEAARWIADRVPPGSRVFIWGYDPMVNYLARRATVSRFLYNYPLVVSWGNPTYEAELLDALRADPPALFLVGSKDATSHVTGTKQDSRALFFAFEELREFVDDHYHFVNAVNRFDVYQQGPVD
jgi:hypothetical protein